MVETATEETANRKKISSVEADSVFILMHKYTGLHILPSNPLTVRILVNLYKLYRIMQNSWGAGSDRGGG